MKIMRVLLFFIMTLSLLFQVAPVAQATNTLDVFALPEDAITCTFADVPEDRWYYENVAYCQSLGLVNGVSDVTFSPYGTLTVAEAVTVAVRIHEIYYGLQPEDEAQEDEVWYLTYLRRAERYGLLPKDLTDYESPILRKDAARLFARTLPASVLPAINEVRCIPGIQASDDFAPALYLLYRAGVLSGKDHLGNFDPEATLSRAELASIVAPLVSPAHRKHFSLTFAGMDAFTYGTGAVATAYADVSPSAWYYSAVMAQTKLGLMNGTGQGRFSPEEHLTVHQTLALAVRVYERYYGLPTTAYADTPAAALAYGICTDAFADLSAPIDRASAAMILYHALPAGEFYANRTVGDIPDVDESQDSLLYPVLHTLYSAGVLSGTDSYGTFGKDGYFTRAQAATILTAMTMPATRAIVDLTNVISHMESYGVSGSGKYPLEVYRLGSGDNVLLLTYLVHGKGEIYADTGVDDGDALYQLSLETLELLRENYALLDQRNWTVYLIPCVNPDGYFDGTQAYSTGRMTAYSYDDWGQLVPVGIDINRSFPRTWERFDYSVGNGEFYNGNSCFVTVNGQASLRCVESQALMEFVVSHRGAGDNILIDTHGFTNQVISTRTDSYVHQVLTQNFPTHMATKLTHGPGYVINYFSHLSNYIAGANDFDGHLFEFAPYEVSIANGMATILPYARYSYQNALLSILQNY